MQQLRNSNLIGVSGAYNCKYSSFVDVFIFIPKV